MTPRRNRISPDLMEHLQVLKFSKKGGETLNFTEEYSILQEKKEWESANAYDVMAPEEVATFTNVLLGVDTIEENEEN